MTVVVLRPEPGASATAEALARAGLEALVAPIFRLETINWLAPSAEGFDALLAGSAAVFRSGGDQLASLRPLPVFAVGDATAEAAGEAGFRVTCQAAGGLQSLLDGLNAPLRLLRLTGEAHVPLSPADGITIETIVTYRAHALPLDPGAADALHTGGIVMLHSGEAARHFAAEVDRLGLNRATIWLACMAPRIAEKAGEGWAARVAARELSDGAVVALAAELCQKRVQQGAKHRNRTIRDRQ